MRTFPMLELKVMMMMIAMILGQCNSNYLTAYIRDIHLHRLHMVVTLLSINTDITLKVQWQLHVPPPITFCSHSVFVCFVCFAEQTAILSLNYFNRFVPVMQTQAPPGFLPRVEISFPRSGGREQPENLFQIYI
jgi:hypothetical protein